MKIKEGFVLREVAGNNIVVPCGEDVVEFTDKIITVNDIGAIIWNGLTEGKNKDEIIEIILQEYDVSREIIDKDYDDFIKTLVDAKIAE